MGLWCTADPEIDDRGRIVRGGMFEHQRRWWQLPNFIKLLVTGYGGGKTMQGCKRGIALALHNAPAPAAIVSPTFPQARETTIATCTDLLRGHQTVRRSFAWQYNKTEHVFTIRHANTIGRLIVYSGEHPERLKGPNLGSVVIDEPFIQDVEVFKQMVARVRHPRARLREIGLTGTPESLNWGYDLAEGDLGQNYDVGVVQADTMANLALDPAYRERLVSQYGTRERQAYVGGEFVNLAAGQVYYGYQPARNDRELDQPANAELGAGMDFGAAVGYASMAAVLFWTDGHRLHVFREYEQANSDTPYLCGQLRDEWVSGRGDGEPVLRDIYPDASGQARQSASGRTDFLAIQEAGFYVNSRSRNPDRRDRYNRVNAMLQSGRLTFDPRGCPKLRRYLGSFTHEQMHKQKQMTHLLDALGYPVCYLFPAEDPHVHTVAVM